MEMKKHPSGLPAEMRKLWIGTVVTLNGEQEEYRQKLRDVVILGKAWCLTVFGSVGNGKTYLSQIAVNTFNNGHFEGGVYTTQPIIQSELKDGRTSQGEVFKRYSSLPCLVIDEISDRPNDWTEYVKTAIENILIERHAQHLRTVLIGNIDGKRLQMMFDARVRDRLNEGIVMQMKGDSLRRGYGDE